MNAVLVLVCVATRFVVLRALQDKSMQTMARTLWDMFCLLGFPSRTMGESLSTSCLQR
jgi:hypothetical protein